MYCTVTGLPEHPPRCFWTNSVPQILRINPDKANNVDSFQLSSLWPQTGSGLHGGEQTETCRLKQFSSIDAFFNNPSILQTDMIFAYILMSRGKEEETRLSPGGHALGKVRGQIKPGVSTCCVWAIALQCTIGVRHEANLVLRRGGAPWRWWPSRRWWPPWRWCAPHRRWLLFYTPTIPVACVKELCIQVRGSLDSGPACCTQLFCN